MVLAALYLFLTLLLGSTFPSSSGSQLAGGLMLVLLAAVAVCAGAISARSLGAGWAKSAISASVSHLVAVGLAFGALPVFEPFDGWGSYLDVEFAVAVTLTTLLAASGMSRRGGASVVFIAALLLAVSLPFDGIGPGLIPALAGFLCWILLPALAGLD